MVEQKAQQYGVPLSIAKALVNQESGGRADATSPVGAAGVMQLMPATARALGVKDPYDPVQNIDGGMRYLMQQYQKYKRWDLALAAYNAGPGNVDKYGGIPPFQETQNYVQNILKNAGMR